MEDAIFVDHSYHKLTKSSDFFLEQLANRFNIKRVYDESWSGGEGVRSQSLVPYKNIFFWQISPTIEQLVSTRGSKIIWCPMLDSVAGMPDHELKSLSKYPMKVICFSKTLYSRLLKIGFNCFYYQYFPNPSNFLPIKDYELSVYFWQRTNDINWPLVKKLLKGHSIKKVDLKDNPDPGITPTLQYKNDAQQYNIKVYKGFLVKKVHDKIVQNSSVYIAPRKYEGIGMSFLEAMARGQIVIAADSPTMNEYIQNGRNGYLFSLEAPSPIKLGNLNQIGHNARTTIEIGYQSYKNSQPALWDYLLSPLISGRTWQKILMRLKN